MPLNTDNCNARIHTVVVYLLCMAKVTYRYTKFTHVIVRLGFAQIHISGDLRSIEFNPRDCV